MKLFRVLALCCFMLCAAVGTTLQAQAQPAQTEAVAQPEVEMADTLRQDGKIYVVVVVLLTVLAGLILYLVALDRKVSRLEKQVQS